MSEFGYAFEVLELFSAGDDIYFVTAGDGFWRSDGTEEGTTKVKDLGGISGLVMVQDQLFFKWIYQREEILLILIT